MELSEDDWLSMRHAVDGGAVDVGVEGRIVLNKVGARLDRYGCGGFDHTELDGKDDGNERVDVDRLCSCAESLHRRCDAIGIEGNVVEAELA